jgi:hypothetical protein
MEKKIKMSETYESKTPGIDDSASRKQITSY